MSTDIFWIETGGQSRLGTMARPRGGDRLGNEIVAKKIAGVDVVVSALTSSEASELGLSEEGKICRDKGIRFLSFPIPDYHTPSSKNEYVKFVMALSKLLQENKSVVIHCKQGIGRSTILAVGTMIGIGCSVDESLLKVQKARGKPVPDTEEQKEWIRACEGMIKKEI